MSRKISNTKNQTVSDILHNLQIIQKKVKQGKFNEEQLKKLDFDLFIWTGGVGPDIRKNPFPLTEINLKRWIYLNLLNYNDSKKAAEEAISTFSIPYLYKGYAIEHLTVLFNSVLFYWKRHLIYYKKDIPKLDREFKQFWRNFVYNILSLPTGIMTVSDFKGTRKYNFDEFWSILNG